MKTEEYKKDPTTGAPITCETCRSMATHARCNLGGDCLHTAEDFARWRTTGDMPPMRFRNWIEGTPQQQLTDYHSDQLSGACNIVIGGQGEAEVNTQWTPEDASTRLHHVAEQCGYMVGRLKQDGDRAELTIQKDGGCYRLEWIAGELVAIYQQKWSNPDYPARPELVAEAAWWCRDQAW